jgi:hypothetical protein
MGREIKADLEENLPIGLKYVCVVREKWFFYSRVYRIYLPMRQIETLVGRNA